MSLETSHVEEIGPGQVRLKLYGPSPALTADTDEVSGSVFAAKLQTLVRALKAADKTVNGGKLTHDYKIARLQSSAPTVTLSERPLKPSFGFTRSGVIGFQDCADAIQSGDLKVAASFGDCALQIGRLAKGAPKNFSYGEVWTAPEKVYRVDDFLVEQSQDVAAQAVLEQPETPKWFTGTSHGSFDGTIKEVDLRGSLPAIKLLLTAGGKQIDCVFRAEDVEMLRAALNRRVRLTGTARYDGRSGLPRRIEHPSIQIIEEGGDFMRWSGAFRPFEANAWDDEL